MHKINPYKALTITFCILTLAMLIAGYFVHLYRKPCLDLDFGNFYIPGFTIFTDNFNEKHVVADRCSPNPEYSEYLNEHYCDGPRHGTNGVSCEHDCQFGACKLF